MATKVVVNMRDFEPLEFGELFQFRGTLFEKKECPCSCGRPSVFEYMTGKLDSALTILMRAKRIDPPNGILGKLDVLQALGNTPDFGVLTLSGELTRSLSTSEGGKFDCTYQLLAGSKKFVWN